MENTKINKTNQEFKITGDWKDETRKLKDKYSQLTDGDLEFKLGNEEEIIRKVQNRLRKNREEVVNILRKVQTEHTS